MKDLLEQVAQNIWRKLELPWNKLETTTHGITEWKVQTNLSRSTLECIQEVELGEYDTYEGPVQIQYEEHHSDGTIWLKARSALNGENAKGCLFYAIPSLGYAELLERMKHTGQLGEKLVQQQRSGNPKIVPSSSWRIQLDNFDDLEELFLRFIQYQN